MLRTARRRVWFEEQSYGLKRDLDVPHAVPEALIDITVRPIRDADVPLILGTDDEALLPAERWERIRRLRLLEAGAGTCFVAVTSDGVPCYTHWLFGHEDNDFIQRYFGGSFPVLGPDTALLEDAFTPTVFRGQRIMSAATTQIAERARSLGARYVITFVTVDNTASLKGCDRAGFTIYTTRWQRWRMLRQSVVYEPVPSEAG